MGPDLYRVLSALVGDGQSLPMVIDCQTCAYQSTFRAEVVTCRFPDGSRRKLFCKHGPPVVDQAHASHGHRGGLGREAVAYRQVLGPLGLTAPDCLGYHHDDATDADWLVLEFLDGAVLLAQSGDRRSIERAAGWSGRFHAAASSALDLARLPGLPVYDAEYYQGWVERAISLAEPLHPRFPWLRGLARRGSAFVAPLLEPPTTVVHGEFFPGNVLVRAGTIHPVDWESAAIAVGELDLAALTLGWPARLRRLMERAYSRCRWPDGAPPQFPDTLRAARLHVCFRLLGDTPEATMDEDSLYLFRTLRALVEAWSRKGNHPCA